MASLALLGLLLFGLFLFLADDEPNPGPGARVPEQLQEFVVAPGPDPGRPGGSPATDPVEVAAPDRAEINPETAATGVLDVGEGGGATVSVEVTCEGRPAPDAVVRLLPSFFTGRGAKGLEGSPPVTFTDLAESTVHIEVSAPECAGTARVVTVKEGESVALQISLQQGWKVRGRVVSDQRYCTRPLGADSTPPSGAVLNINNNDQKNMRMDRTPVAADGTFEVILEPGTYFIGVIDDRRRGDILQVLVDHELELCLVPEGNLGDPHWIEVASERGEACLPESREPPEGFELLPCGGERVSEDCTITGTVRDENGLAPFAEVAFTPSAKRCEDGWPAQHETRPTVTNRQGEFVLAGVPCVTGLMAASRSTSRGFQCREEWLHLTEQTANARLDLLLRRVP